MDTNPLVSVILPVYNTEKYVAAAVESVLAQTYQPIEIVCIDDGSTDSSLSILKTFGDKIRVVESAENGGIAVARNKGIRSATGEFFAFMDADDVWKPEKIETQMRQFREQPDLGISFAHMQCFLSPDLSPEIRDTLYCPPEIMPGYISATALVKRSVFESVGNFDPKWRIGEFIDWFARAKSAGVAFAMLPDVFLLRRIHATNTGVTERASRSDYVRIVKEALDRKRRLGQ